MAHELLWYGLAGFFVLLIVFFILYYLFRILFRGLEQGDGWNLLGLVLVSILGFFFLGNAFSISICKSEYGVFCTIPVRFIVMVGCCILAWRFIVYKKKDL